MVKKLLISVKYISNIEFAVSSNVICPELWLKKLEKFKWKLILQIPQI